MAVRTREEILNSIRERVGNDTSDEAISFIEDITDTLSELETRANDSTDWRSKYEQNDKEWRERYTERFYSSEPETVAPSYVVNEPEKPKDFSDLFTQD